MHQNTLITTGTYLLQPNVEKSMTIVLIKQTQLKMEKALKIFQQNMHFSMRPDTENHNFRFEIKDGICNPTDAGA